MDDIIKFADHVPADMRYVVPTSFLMSTDCVVRLQLLDAHEREVLKHGAKFRHYGESSADIMIGSQTTRGY